MEPGSYQRATIVSFSYGTPKQVKSSVVLRIVELLSVSNSTHPMINKMSSLPAAQIGKFYSTTATLRKLFSSTRSISAQLTVLPSSTTVNDLSPPQTTRRYTFGSSESLSWPSIYLSRICTQFQQQLCILMASILLGSPWTTVLWCMMSNTAILS
jgi:hypothetical protein